MKNKSFCLNIFGVTGHLYRTKTCKALFALHERNLLPKDFKIVGFGRKDFNDLTFRAFNKENILKANPNADLKKLEDFLAHIYYVLGSIEDGAGFDLLKNFNTYNQQLFYLSVPPSFYVNIVENLGKVGLFSDKSYLLIEKPFGTSSFEAENLQELITGYLKESQIFRVDHYLMKQALQDFLNFRKSNVSFEAEWNSDFVQEMEIVLYEDHVLGTRGAFYEKVGALYDVGQNHLLQMMAMTLMEIPKSLSISDTQSSRFQLLESVEVLDQDMSRAQYNGYRLEQGVDPNSDVETFFRISLKINNRRWQNTKFTFSSGKGLGANKVLVRAVFRHELNKEDVIINLAQKKEYLEPYSKMFLDAIDLDQTYFVSMRELIKQWSIVEDIKIKWKNLPLVVYNIGEDPLLIK